MNTTADIAMILKQEKTLVFSSFDENDAFAIGNLIKTGLDAFGKSALIEVRLWDRQLYCCAMKGTNAENADWVRRKVNVVQRFQISSYLKALEMKDAGEVFDREHGTDPLDFAAAGGGFPIQLLDESVIGCITVSGLPQREDHQVVVDALAHHLGIDLGGMILA